jgi:hypothetical protein
MRARLGRGLAHAPQTRRGRASTTPCRRSSRHRLVRTTPCRRPHLGTRPAPPHHPGRAMLTSGEAMQAWRAGRALVHPTGARPCTFSAPSRLPARNHIHATPCRRSSRGTPRPDLHWSSGTRMTQAGAPGRGLPILPIHGEVALPSFRPGARLIQPSPRPRDTIRLPIAHLLKDQDAAAIRSGCVAA